MIKGLKICGVSDPETLNYILNHNHKPTMIGFITNFEKSKRFVDFEKLKDLINVDKIISRHKSIRMMDADFISILKCRAYILNESAKFIDIGVPESYQQAQTFIPGKFQ